MSVKELKPQGMKTTTDCRSLVSRMRQIAIEALRRTYLCGERLFAFRERRTTGGAVCEGVSRRYTAIALLGLRKEAEEVVSTVLGGHRLAEVCDRLVDDVEKMDDLGEVALTLWAARVLDHSGATRALERLRAMKPLELDHPTVELSWALSALAVEGGAGDDEQLAGDLAARLLSSFNPESGLFPHRPDGGTSFRSHVCCFADSVYPIAALSAYHRATRSADARDAAVTCGKRMVELQGPGGQWWWHFDVRTGKVVERYPVYSVHQDSMAPLCLFALEESCGVNSRRAIGKGLRWLIAPSEGKRLIDDETDTIWRKVCRREPGKLSRGLQGLASRLHPALRFPGVDLLFPPRAVDFESRPYHMAWILSAWPPGLLSERADDIELEEWQALSVK